MNKKTIIGLAIAAVVMALVTFKMAFAIGLLTPGRTQALLAPIDLSSYDINVNSIRSASSSTIPHMYGTDITVSTSGTIPHLIGTDAILGGGSFLPNSPMHIQGTVNTFLQVDLQNLSTGTEASADFVMNGASSSNTTYFGNIGFNGPAFSTSTWTICGRDCLYAYSSDGPTAIGTATSGVAGILQFFTGGTLSTNERMRIDNIGNITFRGNLILTTSTTDTVSACGATSTISGGNGRGFVTTGLNASSTCTVTFGIAFPSKPICTVTSETTSSINYKVAPASTTLVISTASSSSFISNTLDYRCD